MVQYDPYKYGQFDSRVGTIDPTIINALIQQLGTVGGADAPNAQNIISQLLGNMQNGRVNAGTSVQSLQLFESQAANILQRLGNQSVSTQTNDSGDPLQVFTSNPVIDTGGGIPQAGPITPPQVTQPTGPVSPVDPGQPLSTPTTPINQGTAPSDINPYIPATSTQQQNIVNQALDQSRGVANQNVGDLTDLFHKNILSQLSNWTDPNSPDYQATMGQLNNVGRADSSTFGQSISSRLAPLISDSLTKTAQGALLPSFLTQQGLVGANAANQSTLGLEPLNRFVELQNFNMQKQLANELADKGSSAQFGSGLGGLLGGGLGAYLGSAAGPVGMMVGAQIGSQGGKAAGGGAGGMTWVCTHLKRLKLATEEEVDAVHQRLRPTIVRHPIHWLHYLLSGPRLIALADAGGADWGAVKQVLIDAVIAEPDSEKAFRIYRDECKRLCERYAPELWQTEVLCTQ